MGKYNARHNTINMHQAVTKWASSGENLSSGFSTSKTQTSLLS